MSPTTPSRRHVLKLGLAAGLALLPAGTDAHDGHFRRDYECESFGSRRQAQRFFNRHDPQDDPFDLDADGDGKACEDYPYGSGSEEPVEGGHGDVFGPEPVDPGFVPEDDAHLDPNP